MADALVDDERKIVSKYIATWRQWYEAYWKLSADISMGELALEDGKDQKEGTEENKDSREL